MQEQLTATEYWNWSRWALGPMARFSKSAVILPFSFYLPAIDEPDLEGCISKAIDTDDRWDMYGPLSDPSVDLEGERMNMEGLIKGLSVFFELEAPVDLDHRWERSGDLQWLIAKGVYCREDTHPKTGERVPFLRSTLYKSKHHARETRGHLQSGGKMGYSVAGGVLLKRRDEVMQTIITSTAATVIPVQSANAGTIGLLKSLRSLEHIEDPEREHFRMPVVPELLETLSPFPTGKMLRKSLWGKALSAGGELPRSGPGIDAAGVEDLRGGLCPKCKRGRGDGCECPENLQSLDKGLYPALLNGLTLLADLTSKR